MEGKSNDKIENSEKINAEICDPATQEKKLVELSPGNSENKNKKNKNKKLNTILKKESRVYFGIPKSQKSLGIKWDNKAIDEQNAYRQRHRLSTVQRHKMKSVSQTKYNSAVIGVEDDDYLKNLIKVNQIKVTDELIKNIIKILNEPKEYKKVRNNSTRLKTPFKFDFHSNAIKSAAKHINVFDGELDLESKITLQNTIINKFHKEVLGTNDDICDQDLNIA